MAAEREKKETFCIACGFPKSRKEMGLTASDPRAAEWQRIAFCKVDLHFCNDCWEERKLWLTDGIRGAAEREEEFLRSGMKVASGDHT